MNMFFKLCRINKKLIEMNKTKIAEPLVVENFTFDFIKGAFTPEDAQEIMSDLLTKKISFHELKSFSNNIRFGSTDENSLERIKELTECKKVIEDQVLLAKNMGKSLRISSQINIDII